MVVVVVGDREGDEQQKQAEEPQRRLRMEKGERSLKVLLTEKELAKLAQELGRKMRMITSLEEDLKAAKSQYNSEIDAKKAEASDLSELARNGYEFRKVPVDIEFDYDHAEGARITVYRNDTGEIVEERPMNETERQRVIEFDAPAAT